MRRTLTRLAFAAGLASVFMAVGAGAAFAAHGHARLGGRLAFQGRADGMGPGGMGGGIIGLGGPGLGGPGFFRGFGGGFGGLAGPGGGGLTADVLTPAASFLGISVSTLASDLNGGKTLAQEATAKNKTAADLIAAIVAAQKANLDNEKAAGWITADQETNLLDVYTKVVTNLVNNGPPAPPNGANPGAGGPLQIVSTYLGISVSDLQTALKNGKTLADEVTAAGNGKTVAGLVTALEAPAKSKLDDAVKNGTITQAQENTILADMTTHLTNMVNGVKPQGAQPATQSSGTGTLNGLRSRLLFLTAVKVTRKH
jgi:hypothetical protein